MPRLKPPFPAGVGLYGCPTTVNNVEIDRGRADHPAPRRGVVRGPRPAEERRDEDLLHQRPREQAVQRRGRARHPVARADRHAIAAACAAAGTICWRVIPGGSSVPVIPKTVCDTVLMDFDSLRDVKSGLGTAAVIVMDKSTDIIRAIARLAQFYKHESCGQCTPCREGTGWMMRVMYRMVQGRAEPEEIDMLDQVTRQIEGHTICALGDAAAWPIQGLIRHFRPEMEARIAAYKATVRHVLATMPSTPSPCRRRGVGPCRSSRSTGSRSRSRPAATCCRPAKRRARKSRASATTTGCRSPATAGCAWSRSRRRRPSRSPPAPTRSRRAWSCTPTARWCARAAAR